MEAYNLWNPTAAAFGWMVIHSLWQITLFYLVYQLAARIWRRHSRVLYLAALAGMVGSAIWAAVTFTSAWENYAQTQEIEAILAPLPTQPSFQNVPVPIQVLPATPSKSQPWHRQFDQWCESAAAPVGWLWSLGALLLALRLLGGYWLSLRIRRYGVRPVPEEWLDQCRNWCARLGIRRPVQWLESTKVGEPLTLGFWKPVVLFPAGMILQLHPKQVETLLLHELAHIRRYDYLVNLVQLGLEICFFYHPLFWLLSKEARSQREYCCDDLVLHHAPDRLLYAKTLTDLQLSNITLNQFAMYAIGKSAFAQRILRLMQIQPDKARRSPGMLLLFVTILSGASLGWSAFTTPSLPKPSEITLTLPDKRPIETVPTNPESPEKNIPSALEIRFDTSSPSPVAVAASNMNVFYIGVDNPVTIAMEGYDCNDLDVRLLGAGRLGKTGDCQYNVVVTQPGEVSIAVYSSENGLQKQLGLSKFRVKRIPADPEPQFGRTGTKEEYRANIEHIGEITSSGNSAGIQLPAPQFVPLPDTLSPSPLAVEANKMNVFYIGVNNPITVAVPGYDCNDLQIKLIGDGTLIPMGGCQYIVQVSQMGKVDIAVFTRKRGKEVQLGVKSFRAKLIPDPVPYIEDYSPRNEISREEIRNALSHELQAVIENFDYDAECNIVQFTVARQEPQVDVVEWTIQGNKIPDHILDRLETLPVGSRIYILDVKTLCPGDSAPRRIKDLVFKIVPDN